MSASIQRDIKVAFLLQNKTEKCLIKPKFMKLVLSCKNAYNLKNLFLHLWLKTFLIQCITVWLVWIEMPLRQNRVHPNQILKLS